VLAAVEFISALGVMLFDLNLNALQTTVTPDAVRARVSGAHTSINYGIRQLGAVVGGVLGTQLRIRETMVIAPSAASCPPSGFCRRPSRECGSSRACSHPHP